MGLIPAVLGEINEREAIVGVVLFGGMFCVAIVAIITDAVQKSMKTCAREQSRREIAAYVAEGSISAEDGAKLIAAGESLKDKIGAACKP